MVLMSELYEPHPQTREGGNLRRQQKKYFLRMLPAWGETIPEIFFCFGTFICLVFSLPVLRFLEPVPTAQTVIFLGFVLTGLASFMASSAENPSARKLGKEMDTCLLLPGDSAS